MLMNHCFLSIPKFNEIFKWLSDWDDCLKQDPAQKNVFIYCNKSPFVVLFCIIEISWAAVYWCGQDLKGFLV